MLRILKKHRIKVALISAVFVLTACAPTTLRLEFAKVQEDAANSLTVSSQSSLAPQSAGTIEPKVGLGQTIMNFKDGDKNLGFNLSLSKSGTGLSTKATTSSSTSFTTSPSASPSTSSTTTSSLTKLVSQVTIDGKTYLIEIPVSKIQDNKHTINLVGLKEGSIVDLKTDAYDDKNQVVSTKTIDKKEVTKDIETVDVNLSISIDIKIAQTTTVNVEQNQVVTGPTINVNVTTAAQPGGGGPHPIGPINTSDCNTIQPDGTVKLTDGTTIKLCPIGTNSTSDCLVPKPDGTVTLPNGKTIKVCMPDPLHVNGKKQESIVTVTVSSATPSPSVK